MIAQVEIEISIEKLAEQIENGYTEMSSNELYLLVKAVNKGFSDDLELIKDIVNENLRSKNPLSQAFLQRLTEFIQHVNREQNEN